MIRISFGNIDALNIYTLHIIYVYLSTFYNITPFISSGFELLLVCRIRRNIITLILQTCNELCYLDHGLDKWKKRKYYQCAMARRSFKGFLLLNISSTWKKCTILYILLCFTVYNFVENIYIFSCIAQLP